jgi:hypothetical protein
VTVIIFNGENKGSQAVAARPSAKGRWNRMNGREIRRVDSSSRHYI